MGSGGEVEAVDADAEVEFDVDLDTVPDDDPKAGGDVDVEDTLRTSGFRMPATLITLRMGRSEAGTVNGSSRGVSVEEEQNEEAGVGARAGYLKLLVGLVPSRETSNL